MLNLALRPEFRGKALKGTVIELRDSKKGGAIERPAEQFLDITYPSIDLLRMIEALQPDKTRTVVLKGGRGQGKSHMLTEAAAAEIIAGVLKLESMEKPAPTPKSKVLPVTVVRDSDKQ